MDPMLLTLGFAAAAVGAVLVANALRAPQVDAEAVLAELDTEPTVLAKAILPLNLDLGVTAFDGVEGAPAPALFTARTVNV